MKLLSKRTLYTTKDGVRTPYLVRITIFQCSLFSIKLHKVLISDAGPLHDHPWSYISLILFGGYTEHTLTGSKWYSPLSVLYRKADQPHKLEIPEGKTCTSLIFTSGKYREWGFNLSNTWISHKKANFYNK